MAEVSRGWNSAGPSREVYELLILNENTSESPRPRSARHLKLLLFINVAPSLVQRFRVRNGSRPWVRSLGYVYASAQVAQLTTKRPAGVSELLIFHPVDTIAKRLMSNKAKVLSHLARSGSRANPIKGLVLLPELDHFPRCCNRSSTQEAAIAIPWSRVRCRIQGFTADLQVRRSTVVQ